jgi:hypothetical protein
MERIARLEIWTDIEVRCMIRHLQAESNTHRKLTEFTKAYCRVWGTPYDRKKLPCGALYSSPDVLI